MHGQAEYQIRGGLNVFLKGLPLHITHVNAETRPVSLELSLRGLLRLDADGTAELLPDGRAQLTVLE